MILVLMGLFLGLLMKVFCGEKLNFLEKIILWLKGIFWFEYLSL